MKYKEQDTESARYEIRKKRHLSTPDPPPFLQAANHQLPILGSQTHWQP